MQVTFIRWWIAVDSHVYKHMKCDLYWLVHLRPRIYVQNCVTLKQQIDTRHTANVWSNLCWTSWQIYWIFAYKTDWSRVHLKLPRRPHRLLLEYDAVKSSKNRWVLQTGKTTNFTLMCQRRPKYVVFAFKAQSTPYTDVIGRVDVLKTYTTRRDTRTTFSLVNWTSSWRMCDISLQTNSKMLQSFCNANIHFITWPEVFQSTKI